MKHAKIKIDGQTKRFKIPQDWHELTTRMFCDLADLHRHKDEPKPSEVIASILGLPHSDVLRIDSGSLDVNVYLHLIFLEDVTGWDSILETKATKRFEVGGKKYKLWKDFSKMTLGQKEEATSIINDNEQPLFDKSYNLLKVFYKDLDRDAFAESAAKDIYPVINFFLTILSYMQIISVKYLQRSRAMRKN